MGQDAAATVTAIEDTREQLGRDLAVLETRLPDREEATQAAAISAGAVVATIGSVWFGWSRYRRTKERREVAALLHDAGLEATGERPGTSGGVWRIALGLVAGATAGAAGYLSTRHTLSPDEPLWVEP